MLACLKSGGQVLVDTMQEDNLPFINVSASSSHSFLDILQHTSFLQIFKRVDSDTSYLFSSCSSGRTES